MSGWAERAPARVVPLLVPLLAGGVALLLTRAEGRDRVWVCLAVLGWWAVRALLRRAHLPAAPVDLAWTANPLLLAGALVLGSRAPVAVVAATVAVAALVLAHRLPLRSGLCLGVALTLDPSTVVAALGLLLATGLLAGPAFAASPAPQSDELDPARFCYFAGEPFSEGAEHAGKVCTRSDTRADSMKVDVFSETGPLPLRWEAKPAIRSISEGGKRP